MRSAMWTWLQTKFELSRHTAGVNLHVMEGMRGFAVGLVFLTHFCTLSRPWLAAAPALSSLADAVHAIGSAGVDLFFVLSGYLIYKSLMARDQPFGRFMARRIRRIYPTFLVVFAVYCLLSLVFPSQSKFLGQAPLAYLIANLLLLPGLFPIEPLITVAWSLSYEMFFYLCLPLVIGGLGLRRWSGGWRIVLIAGAAAALVAWNAVFEGRHARMIMFMAGMLVHEALSGRRGPAVSGRWTAAILVAGLSSSLLPITGYLQAVILCGSFYLVCMNCFLRPGDALGRVFAWTPLRWLGNMSYSYYLFHGLALKAMFMLLPPPGLPGMPLVLLLPAAFALTLAASAGLYLAVELPLSLRAPGTPRAGLRHGPASPGTNR